MPRYRAKPRKKDKDFKIENLIQCIYCNDRFGICQHPILIIGKPILVKCNGVKKSIRCPLDFLDKFKYSFRIKIRDVMDGFRNQNYNRKTLLVLKKGFDKNTMGGFQDAKL